jgi:hypothetical protein
MTRDIAERLWTRVQKGDEATCRLWLGAVNENGYGRMGAGGRGDGTPYVHRVAWELERGPIPEGMTIDHLCRVRTCVNPAHLELVTLAENIRRAKRRLTHCKHGHEFTQENTYWRKEGRRMCRACRTERRAA